MRLSALALLAAGCASASTAEDARWVRDDVRRRASLYLPERDVPADVARLLAQPLTAETAAQIAVLNDHELRAALLQLGVARGQLVQASVLPNPTFALELRQIAFAEDTDRKLRGEVAAGFSLVDLILVRPRTAAAEAELDVARREAAAAVLDEGLRVRLAFIAVAATQQKLEVLRRGQAAYDAGLEAARALHDAGNLGDLDFANERAAAETGRLAVFTAEADVADARARLSAALGITAPDPQWRVEATLAEPTATPPGLDELEERAVAASLDLAVLRGRVTALDRRGDVVALGGWLRDLTVGVHGESDGKDFSIGPSLSGQLPVFDRHQGDRASLHAEIDVLGERQAGAAAAIRAAVRAVRARFLSAEARARALHDQVLPARAEVLRQSQLMYNGMQIGVFQLLMARRDELEASRLYLDTLEEYWRLRALLEQLAAGRMPRLP